MKARAKSSASSSPAVSSRRGASSKGAAPPLEERLLAAEIYDAILRVLTIARDEHIPSYKAADRLAERRLAEAAASKLRRKGT